MTPEQRIAWLSEDFLELVFDQQGKARLVTRADVLAWFSQTSEADRWDLTAFRLVPLVPCVNQERVMTRYRLAHWRASQSQPGWSDHLSLWRKEFGQWRMFFHQSLAGK